MKKVHTILLGALVTVSCAVEMSNTIGNVGDITFDPKVDNADFKICNEHQILQYYNFGQGPNYLIDKDQLKQILTTGYSPEKYRDQSGYFTIRFVVNCEGNAGRFRTESMDFNYQQHELSPALSAEIQKRVAKIRAWRIHKYNNEPTDYYQYLTFKIERGKISEILP